MAEQKDILERAVDLVEEGNPCNIGICIECGEEQGGVEPDAREYECESCGAKKVFGCDEIIMMYFE